MLIPGFFDDFLKPELYASNNLRRCSLCVVDCDLYSSTVPVLKFMRPLLAVNSVVYFDDWGDFGPGEEKGEPLAFREFFAEAKDLAFQPLPLIPHGGKGMAFIVTEAPRRNHVPFETRGD